MILPRLTVLEDQYAIGRVLDEDRPFEVTYQAWDLMTEDQVVLKEYFPRTLARREEGSTQLVWEATDEELYQYGLEQFIQEAEALAALDHQNLVREVQRFEANGTAYRALEHHAGAMLSSVLKQQGGKLAPKTALGIIMPVLNGLKVAHGEDLIHAGITPEAVFLAKSGRPLLIDFRMAQAMLARRMKKPHLLAEDGFAAPEQYLAEGPQGPWTDVYGVAATLYYMMTGDTLPAAYERLEADPVPGLLEQIGGVPAQLREMLHDALAMEPAERTRTAEALQDQLLSLAKRKDIKEGRPATTAEGDEATETATAAASAIAMAEQFDGDAPDASEDEGEPEADVAGQAAEMTAADEDDLAEADQEAAAEETGDASEEMLDPDAPTQESFADGVAETETDDAEAVADEPVADDEPTVETDDTILMTSPPSFEEEAPDAAEDDLAEADADAEAEPVEAEADDIADEDEEADVAPVAEDEAAPEPVAALAPDRAARSRSRASRKKETSRGSISVLAAVLAVVVIASLGGYLVMNPGGEGDRFAYYKARGDSLFERSEFEAAKNEYEQALSFQADETVAERVTELEDRIAEREQQAYLEQLQAGDSRYQRGDSLLQAGESNEALRFFAEANRAYMQAARLNPQADSAAIAKAEQASEAMNTASAEAGSDGQSDEEALNEQLYTSYRQQGDALLRQGDLGAAQRKFEEALEYRPGDRYAQNRLNEIASRMSEAEAEEDFQRLITRANQLCEQGQCAEAVDEYQSALEIEPDDQAAQQGLARAQEARRAAEAQSQRYQYFRGQGDTYLAQGNFDAAIASYESALEQRPDDSYAQQKIEEARRALQAQQQQQAEASAEQEQSENVTDEGVYLVAEQPPKLVGGLAALHRKVRYPEEAYAQNVEGRVYVQFVVDENGSVQNAEVMRGLGHGCDEEALRVIREARFEPGTIDGEPVKVRHTLYIQYKR